jgi:hypothetical protein
MAIKTQALADFVVECTINNQEVGGQEVVVTHVGQRNRNIGCSIFTERQKQNQEEKSLENVFQDYGLKL